MAADIIAALLALGPWVALGVALLVYIVASKAAALAVVVAMDLGAAWRRMRGVR